MNITIVDYKSGNISSVINSFNEVDKDKVKIIKSLWKIIYSNKNADIFETNLMRRLSGLLYLDSKIVGDLKEKIKSNL